MVVAYNNDEDDDTSVIELFQPSIDFEDTVYSTKWLIVYIVTGSLSVCHIWDGGRYLSLR